MTVQMQVSARQVTPEDLPALIELYHRLLDEMIGLHPMWPRADGLAEPIEDAFLAAIDDSAAHVLVGEVDDVPFGFILGRVETTLPQTDHEEIGVIRLVFTDPEAREIGVAEAMRDLVMDLFRQRGITKFDAHVLPGHRLAKNFFEAGGFSARSIVMHHDDHPTERPARDPRRL